jgi:hypothetical protein
VSLEDRVRRLEDDAPEPRCDNCRSWDDVIVHQPLPGESAPRDEPPKVCELCGFTPVIINVIYDEATGNL